MNTYTTVHLGREGLVGDDRRGWGYHTHTAHSEGHTHLSDIDISHTYTNIHVVDMTALRASGVKGWLETTRMGMPTPLTPGSDLPYAT